jgi:hypothetical protein
LDGWNGYKFGMSPDAARAVPGQTFGPYSSKNLMNENKGAMAAKKESPLYGLSWALNLFFDSNGKMNALSLENEKKSSRDACEKTFLNVLAQLEKSYGGLSPVNPERKRKETDTPPTSLEYRLQGASRYQFATVALDDEYAFVWQARKSVGGNYVDLTATWSGKPEGPEAPCIADINYSGK